MKNIYIPIVQWQVVLLMVLLFASVPSYAQVVKPFTQRTSPYAQAKYKKDAQGKIYNLRGDFAMAGNSNLTMNPYSNTAGNNSNMVYVDIDGDGTTVNSSSAVLGIPNDGCTEIVYAGLYWSGRVHDATTSGYTLDVTKSVPTTTTTTQILNHTHSGTNNLDNTTVSIARSLTANDYYPIQLVTIGDKQIEFTVNNDGTVFKRERIGNAAWSASVQVAVSTDISNLSTTNSNTSWARATGLDQPGNVGTTYYCYRGYTRTNTETISGRKIFTLTSPIVYNYNNVNYTVSQLASYFISTRTRTEQGFTRKTRATAGTTCNYNNGTWNDNNGAYYNTSIGAYTAPVYNATLANFQTSNNNYVTISGPKTQTGSVNSNWTLDKRVIKLKKEGQPYTTFTAANADILYPDGDYGNMYAAYKDVTEYVRQNGVGNYFAADIATAEGSGGNTGFYGGWGLVVVYANPTMKWRDITVYDGYAYVIGGAAEHNLPISGFESAQNGPVNVTIGFMAGEGDIAIDNDYLRVLKKGGNINTAADWINLGNTGNTGGAFYSNINTGGNVRNPNNLNNASYDMQKFDLPNQTGGTNVIIGNSQTSTTFKYGSDQDTYIIYNMVFAVDAYVPEVEGVNQILTSATTADINNLQPGDEVTYTFDVYNYGSDIIDNAKIDVDIPYAMKVVSYSMQQYTQAQSGATAAYNFSQPQWVNPATGIASNIQPATIDGGIIRWTLGTIPTQSLVADFSLRKPMARLTYKLRVTNDCMVLKTSKDECALKPEINGHVTGTGRNSGKPLSTGFITGYDSDCNNTPIYSGINMQINPSQAFLTACSLDQQIEGETKIFKKFCQVANNEILRSEIVSQYVAGTKFYSNLPNSASPLEVTGNFPVNINGTQTMYYAVLPGANQACFYQLATKLDVITQQPDISNVDVCFGTSYVLTPIIPFLVGPSYYYFENGSATPSMPFTQPTKPGIYTYQVALGQEENGVYCYGPKKTFTITIRNCKTPVNPMIYTPLNR